MIISLMLKLIIDCIYSIVCCRNDSGDILMANFIVSDMTCGHCVKSITQAIKDNDASAELNFDLNNKVVEVNSILSNEDVINLLDDIGFTAEAK